MVQERPFARCSERTLRPQTDVSANKMLRSARMAAMTGRTAAFLGGGQWRLRAVNGDAPIGVARRCCKAGNGFNKALLSGYFKAANDCSSELR
jgi:hypothetical protein